MQDYGLVSIIMPTYNSSNYIHDSIESVISQSYKNWELIITDDFSTDSTCDIIQRYCDKDNRIKLYRLNKNQGAGVARNNSIRYASGKYMAFLDSDDLWLPYKLERQLSFMIANNYIVSYTSSLTCDENGNVFAFNPAYKKVSYKQICNCDKCGTTELIYDVSRIGKIEMPALRRRQDWAFKILLLAKSKYAYGMYDTLSMYRIRRDSLSRNKFKLIQYNVEVYKTVLSMHPFSAWLKFIFNFMPTYTCKRIRQRVANSSL